MVQEMSRKEALKKCMHQDNVKSDYILIQIIA